MQILVLDDERVVGERLQASLKKEDHTVEIFTRPTKALDRLKEKIFDVVITDIRMDDIDGIQILETVRKTSDKTKVIMITGYATMEIARESLTKGAFDFIAKPFKLREIRAAIQKAEDALLAENK